jgi:hypothetical protein
LTPTLKFPVYNLSCREAFLHAVAERINDNPISKVPSAVLLLARITNVEQVAPLCSGRGGTFHIVYVRDAEAAGLLLQVFLMTQDIDYPFKQAEWFQPYNPSQ